PRVAVVALPVLQVVAEPGHHLEVAGPALHQARGHRRAGAERCRSVPGPARVVVVPPPVPQPAGGERRDDLEVAVAALDEVRLAGDPGADEVRTVPGGAGAPVLHQLA